MKTEVLAAPPDSIRSPSAALCCEAYSVSPLEYPPNAKSAFVARVA